MGFVFVVIGYTPDFVIRETVPVEWVIPNLPPPKVGQIYESTKTGDLFGGDLYLLVFCNLINRYALHSIGRANIRSGWYENIEDVFGMNGRMGYKLVE